MYSKAIVIKTLWYRYRNRHIEQWNRAESSERNPCMHGQLICDKKSRIFNGKRTVSSINSVGRARSDQFSSVQFSCSVVSDSLQPMNPRTPGLPVHHQLLEFTQTHVHQVGDAIQPSHPLSSPSPAPNPSQHQGSFPMSQLFAWGGQSNGRTR